MPRLITYGAIYGLALAALVLCSRYRAVLTRMSLEMAESLGDALKVDQQAGIAAPLP